MEVLRGAFVRHGDLQAGGRARSGLSVLQGQESAAWIQRPCNDAPRAHEGMEQDSEPEDGSTRDSSQQLERGMVDSSLRASFHAFDKEESEGEAGILPDMLGADEDRAPRQVEVGSLTQKRGMGGIAAHSPDGRQSRFESGLIVVLVAIVVALFDAIVLGDDSAIARADTSKFVALRFHDDLLCRGGFPAGFFRVFSRLH